MGEKKERNKEYQLRDLGKHCDPDTTFQSGVSPMVQATNAHISSIHVNDAKPEINSALADVSSTWRNGGKFFFLVSAKSQVWFIIILNLKKEIIQDLYVSFSEIHGLMYVHYIIPPSSLLPLNHDPDILNKGANGLCGNTDGCLRTSSFPAVVKVKKCHGDELWHHQMRLSGVAMRKWKPRLCFQNTQTINYWGPIPKEEQRHLTEMQRCWCLKRNSRSRPKVYH